MRFEHDRVRGPGGWYRLAVTEFGLLTVAFPGGTRSSFLAQAAEHLKRAQDPELARNEPEQHLAQFTELVQEWSGETAWHCFYFPPPLDLRGSAFHRKVWRVLRTLPPGETESYGELARRAGSPRAGRAVGTAMNKNPTPLFVPCHRVVSSTGLGGFGSAGLDLKRRLLALEGVRPESRVASRQSTSRQST